MIFLFHLNLKNREIQLYFLQQGKKRKGQLNEERSRVGPIYGLHPLNLMIDISRIPFFVKNRNFILFIESG